MGKQKTCRLLRNSVSSASIEMLGRKINTGKRLEIIKSGQFQSQMRNTSDTIIFTARSKRPGSQVA